MITTLDDGPPTVSSEFGRVVWLETDRPHWSAASLTGDDGGSCRDVEQTQRVGVAEIETTVCGLKELEGSTSDFV